MYYRAFLHAVILGQFKQDGYTPYKYIWNEK